MNDDIKETLECMKEIADCTFTTDTFELNFKDTKTLLDYITNLQELCDKYEEEHNTTFKEWQKDIQANKEAIEYIKIQQTIFKDYDITIENQLKNISNILEGKNEYNK